MRFFNSGIDKLSQLNITSDDGRETKEETIVRHLSEAWAVVLHPSFEEM